MRHWSLISGLVMLMACSQGRIFGDFEVWENGWTEQDTAAFAFEIEDETLTYDLSISLRHTIDYPFNNLYYTYRLVSPQGDPVETELKEVILFEPKTGRPLGSGLGDVFDHEFEILKNYSFDQSGVYSMEFYHYMRVDTLSSLDRVGLQVWVTQ